LHPSISFTAPSRPIHFYLIFIFIFIFYFLFDLIFPGQPGVGRRRTAAQAEGAGPRTLAASHDGVTPRLLTCSAKP
jgi:hypothetical protein